MLSHNLRFLLLVTIVLLHNYLFATTDKYRCMWNDDPSTTMTIGWEQVSGHNSIVYYSDYDGGQNIDNYSFSKKVDSKIWAKGMNNYFARLTNLRANTRYHFLIKDSEGVSRQMSFKTAPDTPYERLSIIAGGDSRNHRKARSRANMLVSKLRPHAVMFGGDMTGGDIERQWKAWFDDWQITMTSDGHLTPLIVARGNHEEENKSLVDLFDVKSDGIYYALNLGGNLLRIYTLNSEIAAGGNQAEWLESDLNRNKDVKWKFAQYHRAIRPHHSKKTNRNTQLKSWATLFYKYGVDLVCESDSHVAKTTYPIRPSKESGSHQGFIRDDEQGTVYVGEGCWGAPLRRNDNDKSWTRASGSFNQFKWIFVDMDGVEVRTVKVDNAAEVGTVSSDDIFSAPYGLDIWNPSNGTGSVLRISDNPYVAYNNTPTNTSTTKPSRDLPKETTKSKQASIPDSPTILTKRKSQTTNSSARLINVKPIEIYNLKAMVNGDGAILKWVTKNEYMIPTFEVQRSTDGRTYTTFARIQGTGNHNGKANSYKFKDNLQGVTEGIMPQYRLRHTSRNGEVLLIQAMSEQVEVKVEKLINWNNYARLEKNPQTGQVQFKYKLNEPADKVSIKLLDSNEKQVHESEFRNVSVGNFMQSLDVSQMAQGEYLLIIEANHKVIQQFRVDNGK